MKEVCDRHGALFILDEVFAGMGRKFELSIREYISNHAVCIIGTGTLHAWEQEGVEPDLQTVGQYICALSIHCYVVKIIENCG